MKIIGVLSSESKHQQESTMMKPSPTDILNIASNNPYYNACWSVDFHGFLFSLGIVNSSMWEQWEEMEVP